MNSMTQTGTVLETRDVTISYGATPAVRGVTLAIPEREVLALIGPSGCGKSTLLRCFNRMNDFIPSCGLEGRVLFEELDIYAPHVDPVELRQRIGMVFQRPNPFPKSIRANITWAPRMAGYRGDLDELVERTLREAALWEESKDKLDKSALSLSGGQQQRLCIARSLAMSPEVLLMDEPCSALDPIATGRIEELIRSLRRRYTVVIVTHNLQQASRVADSTAFMYQGELISRIIEIPVNMLRRFHILSHILINPYLLTSQGNRARLNSTNIKGPFASNPILIPMHIK